MKRQNYVWDECLLGDFGLGWLVLEAVQEANVGFGLGFAPTGPALAAMQQAGLGRADLQRTSAGLASVGIRISGKIGLLGVWVIDNVDIP